MVYTELLMLDQYYEPVRLHVHNGCAMIIEKLNENTTKKYTNM